MIEFLKEKKYLKNDYQMYKKKRPDKSKNIKLNKIATIFFLIFILSALINKDYTIAALISLFTILNLLISFKIKENIPYKLILILINLVGTLELLRTQESNYFINYYVFLLFYIFHIIIYFISTAYVEYYYYNVYIGKKSEYVNKAGKKYFILILIAPFFIVQNQTIINLVCKIILAPCITYIESSFIKKEKGLF